MTKPTYNLCLTFKRKIEKAEKFLKKQWSFPYLSILFSTEGRASISRLKHTQLACNFFFGDHHYCLELILRTKEHDHGKNKEEKKFKNIRFHSFYSHSKCEAPFHSLIQSSGRFFSSHDVFPCKCNPAPLNDTQEVDVPYGRKRPYFDGANDSGNSEFCASLTETLWDMNDGGWYANNQFTNLNGHSVWMCVCLLTRLIWMVGLPIES